MIETMDNIQTKLASAISKTMESMTFEDVEVVTDETVDPYLGDHKLWAVLPVIEPYSGELVLVVPLACAKILAAEAFGEIDAERSLEELQDLVGEILNTLAGRFLDELTPSGETFQLGVPTKGQGKLPQFDDEITSVLWGMGEYYLKTLVVGKELQRANDIKKRGSL